jgi:hypothetical protein
MDDGCKEVRVDVVLGASVREKLGDVGGGRRGGWREDGDVGGGRSRVGDRLDAEDGRAGDFEIAGVLGGGSGNEVKADVIAVCLVVEAVELEAVAEGDVLGCPGAGARGRQGGDGGERECGAAKGTELHHWYRNYPTTRVRRLDRAMRCVILGMVGLGSVWVMGGKLRVMGVTA